LQILAVYFLFGIGLAILSGYDAKRESYSQEKQSAYRQQYQASRDIAGECAVPNAPPSIVAECLASEIEAYERSKNTDQDLQAQQDMAYWALWMFVASGIGVVVSIGGLVLLLRSLRQTKEAISIDREVGHAQVRAYLAIVDQEPPRQIKPGIKLSAPFKIKNTGQSPARNVRYIAALLIREYPLQPGMDLIVPAAEQTKPSITMAAGRDFGADAETMNPLTKDDIDVMMSADGSHRLYLVCHVYYDDVFRNECITRFCASLGRTGDAVDGPDGKPVYGYSWMIAPYLNDET